MPSGSSGSGGNKNLFKDLMRIIFPGAGAIGGAVTAPARSLGKAKDFINQMQTDYGGYTSSVERLLKESPQIDLSSYIDRLGGYADTFGDYATDLLDSLLGSASTVEGRAQTSLDEMLSSFGSYLNRYRDLARQGMPGEDIYRGMIGAGTSRNLQRMKDIGGLTGSSFNQALASESQQLRDLALQSSMYRSQRQQDLANAYGQYGQMVGGAYGQNINALQNAASMRSGAYTGAANMQNMAMGATQAQAGLEQTQFNYNQFIPWQTAVNYNANMAGATIPYQTGAQFYGQLYANQLMQQQAMMQGAVDLFSGFQQQGQQAAGMMIGMPGISQAQTPSLPTTPTPNSYVAPNPSYYNYQTPYLNQVT